MDKASESILALKPVTFHYNDQSAKINGDSAGERFPSDGSAAYQASRRAGVSNPEGERAIGSEQTDAANNHQ